jgi:hypothetical protein
MIWNSFLSFLVVPGFELGALNLGQALYNLRNASGPSFFSYFQVGLLRCTADLPTYASCVVGTTGMSYHIRLVCGHELCQLLVPADCKPLSSQCLPSE